MRIRCLVLAVSPLFFACTRAPAPAELGSWRVVGHRSPAISAMSDSAADAWIGTRAEYSRRSARFGTESCPSPEYTHQAVSVDDLARGYRTDVSSLQIMQDSVRVITTTCNGMEWIAPGATLIQVAPDTLYTVWDGVFFQLTRERARRRP